MNEFYIELLTDALHLSHDQGQMSDEDYRQALEFVENGFRGPQSDPRDLTDQYRG